MLLPNDCPRSVELLAGKSQEKSKTQLFPGTWGRGWGVMVTNDWCITVSQFFDNLHKKSIIQHKVLL